MREISGGISGLVPKKGCLRTPSFFFCLDPNGIPGMEKRLPVIDTESEKGDGIFLQGETVLLT